MIYYDPKEVLEKGRRVEPLFPGEIPFIEEDERLAGLIEENGHFFSPDLTNERELSNYSNLYSIDYSFGLIFYAFKENEIKNFEKQLKVPSKDITEFLRKSKN